MNISCDIIRDVLPLYAEDMVSVDTKQMVDEHLCGCDGCTKLLGQMLKKEQIPSEVELDSLNKVKANIRKRRRLAQLLVFFLTAAITVGLFAFLTRPIYLTAEQAGIRIIEEEDKLVLQLGDNVDCYFIEGDYYGEEDMTYTITAYRRLWNVHYGNMLNARYRVLGEDYPFSFSKETARILYGNAPMGEEDSLIWGQPVEEHYIMLPRLVLGYYILIAAALGMLLLIAAWLVRKTKAGQWLAAGSSLFLCISAAGLIVTGGDWRLFVQSDMLIYAAMTGVLSLLLWLACICGWKYVKLGRQDF